MSVTTEGSKDELFSNLVCDTLPTHSMYCHNLDFSTFPLLCEMVHKHLTNMALTSILYRGQRVCLPYAVFQHYMTVLLNIHLTKYNGYNTQFLYVPDPIAEYLSAITTTRTLTGDMIQVNIPKIAIPQLAVPEKENEAAIPPGSFGRLTAENHNVYECYVSPYITRRLVEQTREQVFGPWNPLPNGAYPPGTMPNKNLLGYAEPDKLTLEDVTELKKYKFPNGNGMMGRLQIVPELMRYVHDTLSKYSRDYELVYFNTIQQKGTQKSENLVGVTKVSTSPYGMYSRNIQISKLEGDIFSPYALKSMSVKMSMLYGLKRSRTTTVPGFCYTKPDGEAPDNWEHSINHNFNMKEPFQATKFLDYPHLRDKYHIATLPQGYKIDFIIDWIESYNRNL